MDTNNGFILSYSWEDNWRTEIALSVEKLLRTPLNTTWDTMKQMKQAMCTLIIAMDKRRQGDESSDEEGQQRPQDSKRAGE